MHEGLNIPVLVEYPARPDVDFKPLLVGHSHSVFIEGIPEFIGDGTASLLVKDVHLVVDVPVADFCQAFGVKSKNHVLYHLVHKVTVKCEFFPARGYPRSLCPVVRFPSQLVPWKLCRLPSTLPSLSDP